MTISIFQQIINEVKGICQPVSKSIDIFNSIPETLHCVKYMTEFSICNSDILLITEKTPKEDFKLLMIPQSLKISFGQVVLHMCRVFLTVENSMRVITECLTYMPQNFKKIFIIVNQVSFVNFVLIYF